MDNMQVKISGIIEEFTNQITAVVREEAVQTVIKALGGDQQAQVQLQPNEPKPKRKYTKRKKQEVTSTDSADSSEQTPTPKAAGINQIREYITRNPGSKISEIKKGLGCEGEHSAFSRNIKTLLERGYIVSQGESVERIFFSKGQAPTSEEIPASILEAAAKADAMQAKEDDEDEDENEENEEDEEDEEDEDDEDDDSDNDSN